jgi:hypothetical protein
MNKVAKTKYLNSSTALQSHRTCKPLSFMSRTISTTAAKLGYYEERNTRSAQHYNSTSSPPDLSFCSHKTHSYTYTIYMLNGTGGNTVGCKMKASSTIIPMTPGTSIHDLST